MNVLVACECSGVVRDAFRARGHNAWSCDYNDDESLTLDGEKYHFIGDVRRILGGEIPLDMMPDQHVGIAPIFWDLLIAHPPCTHLAVCGALHFHYKQREQEKALDFVRVLMAAPIKRKAIENPISVISTRIRKPDQIIQPWMFGHGETKATCLWLENLPLLVPTNIVEGREGKIRDMKGKNRKHDRSKTYLGIGDAMAEQWGCLDAN